MRTVESCLDCNRAASRATLWFSVICDASPSTAFACSTAAFAASLSLVSTAWSARSSSKRAFSRAFTPSFISSALPVFDTGFWFSTFRPASRACESTSPVSQPS